MKIATHIMCRRHLQRDILLEQFRLQGEQGRRRFRRAVIKRSEGAKAASQIRI